MPIPDQRGRKREGVAAGEIEIVVVDLVLAGDGSGKRRDRKSVV